MSNRNQAEISARPSGAGGAAAAEVDAPDENARREMLATGRAVREMWEKLYADWPNRPPHQKDRKKAMAELRAMQAKEWPEGPPDMGDFHARTRTAMARVEAEGDGEGVGN